MTPCCSLSFLLLEYIANIGGRAILETIKDIGSHNGGKLSKRTNEALVRGAFDQGQPSLAVLSQCFEDVGSDVLCFEDGHSSFQQLSMQTFAILCGPQIREQEVTARTQDPCDLQKKGGHRSVAVRGFDVNDRVKRLVSKRKSFRVAVDKRQTVDTVIFPTKTDRLCGKIDAGHLFGMMGPCDEGRPASPAASHFEHFAPFQLDRPGNVAV